MLARLALAALLATAPALVRADDAGVARCGTRKVAALARACRGMLLAEAAHLRRGDTAARDARRAALAARLATVWARAERAAGDSRCSTDTAPAAAAAQRLAAAVDATLAELAASTSCKAALARVWAPLCRRTAASEIQALRGRADAAAARRDTVARVYAKLDKRWPVAGCDAVDATQAGAPLLALAAGVGGEATTRGAAALAGEAAVDLGAAIEPAEVDSDAAYLPVLAHDLTSLTAENAMKWGPVHPQPAQWSFAAADAVVARAESLGQRLRGHTLVWGALQLPAYVSAAASAAELRGYLQDHIATLVGRYAGRVAQWDVVNEPLPAITDPPTPDGLDDNIFRQLLGPGYIAEALQLARAADPTAALFINENGIEVPGPRQDRFYALVQDLLAAGAPLDGVGFQAHLGLIPPAQYPDRATIEASLQRFADLGLAVEITELDVALLFRAGDLDARFAFQGGYYRDVAAACLAVPACSGLTTWGLSDQYTWLRTFLGVTDWPLPFDDAWRRKPAYFGLRSALLERLLNGS